MCGLVGIFGTLLLKHEDALKDMLQMDVLRGKHSTGIAAVSIKGNVIISKDAKLPQQLMAEEDFKRGFRQVNIMIMGHNRHATMGKINQENAHPFFYEGDHGLYLGSHNGTIHEKWRFPKGHEYDTDSQALVGTVSVIGLEETWKKLNGAAAVAIYEVNKESLALARNDKRPLFYSFSKDKRVLFWASEPWIIRVACERNGVELGKIMFLGEQRVANFWMKGNEVKHVVGKLSPFTPPDYDWQSWRKPNTAPTGLDNRFKDKEKKKKENKIEEEEKSYMENNRKKEEDSNSEAPFPVLQQTLSTSDSTQSFELGAEMVYKGHPIRSDVLHPESYLDPYGCLLSYAVDPQYFFLNYPRCSSCNEDICTEADSEGSMIINEDRAICGNCYSTIISHGMDPSSTHSFLH